MGCSPPPQLHSRTPCTHLHNHAPRPQPFVQHQPRICRGGQRQVHVPHQHLPCGGCRRLQLGLLLHPACNAAAAPAAAASAAAASAPSSGVHAMSQCISGITAQHIERAHVRQEGMRCSMQRCLRCGMSCCLWVVGGRGQAPHASCWAVAAGRVAAARWAVRQAHVHSAATAAARCASRAVVVGHQ